ncbi:Tox-REase-5 domain-containing protein [Yoonia sp. 2307UL14-13]|uniref:Tox-REase-5 domain-containing protein n=1 Tax=Yoonia sp. 2307UL14-13 TaxID=3126506 RepID=UPI0030A954F3
MGQAKPTAAPQTPAAQKRGYDYQHFLFPWHWYAPETAKIQEWEWKGIDFDALHPTECHLYEAKHGYNGFLRHSDVPTPEWEHGVPELQEWATRKGGTLQAFRRMVIQGRNQHLAVAPHNGEVHLTWVFSHGITRTYVGALFLTEIDGWYHEMEVKPFGGQNDTN